MTWTIGAGTGWAESDSSTAQAVWAEIEKEVAPAADGQGSFGTSLAGQAAADVVPGVTEEAETLAATADAAGIRDGMLPPSSHEPHRLVRRAIFQDSEDQARRVPLDLAMVSGRSWDEGKDCEQRFQHRYQRNLLAVAGCLAEKVPLSSRDERR